MATSPERTRRRPASVTPGGPTGPVPPARPRRNRVTPLGELIATPARGAWMGNRGRLHDAGGRVVRTVVPSYRAWVTCRLEFRGRRRPLMAPGRYTELFFLDEATALAAGHRPCGECRRADYRRFRTAWLSGNVGRGLDQDAPMRAIDRELDADRRAPGGRRRTFEAPLGTLPDGTFVELAGEPWLVWRGRLAPWTPAGYRTPVSSGSPATIVTVVTPRSTVAAIAAGYAPAVHPTADG